MKGQSEPPPHHPEKPCNICGNVGSKDALVTCCKCCITCEHVYCMRVFTKVIPKFWVCEECLLRNDMVSPISVQGDGFLDSCDIAQAAAPSKVCVDSQRLIHHKKLNSYETGKVKYLPVAEAIRLSSGTSGKECHEPNDSRTAMPSEKVIPGSSIARVKETSSSKLPIIEVRLSHENNNFRTGMPSEKVIPKFPKMKEVKRKNANVERDTDFWRSLNPLHSVGETVHKEDDRRGDELEGGDEPEGDEQEGDEQVEVGKETESTREEYQEMEEVQRTGPDTTHQSDIQEFTQRYSLPPYGSLDLYRAPSSEHAHGEKRSKKVHNERPAHSTKRGRSYPPESQTDNVQILMSLQKIMQLLRRQDKRLRRLEGRLRRLEGRLRRLQRGRRRLERGLLKAGDGTGEAECSSRNPTVSR